MCLRDGYDEGVFTHYEQSTACYGTRLRVVLNGKQARGLVEKRCLSSVGLSEEIDYLTTMKAETRFLLENEYHSPWTYSHHS